MKIAGLALRLGVAALPAWWVGVAIAAPEVPRLASAAAVMIVAATLWRPDIGLLAVACLAPAGALLAPGPVRATELLGFAFLAAWLLRIWAPLASRGWPRVSGLAGALYLLAILASWLALSIGSAAGVTPATLPRFLLWLIPPDHLVYSSPEAETWTMLQNVAGLGLFFAAAALTRRDSRLLLWLIAALAVSCTALSLLTLADVRRQWADVEYAGWFLRRFAWGERFSLHLADPNAAASLYALAGTSAGVLTALDARRRWLWAAAGLTIVPAMMLAGSVSANIAVILTGTVVLAIVVRSTPWKRASTGIVSAGAVLIVVAAMMSVTTAGRTESRATATEALALRAGFLETSVRMFGSAPVFGVGIGRYFDRSGEFMPAALREFYGNENAHNYFAQQFAELGAAGGALFIWVVVAAIGAGWRKTGSNAVAEAPTVALAAGATAYVLTCLTGHPLLVPGAALPFWAALGALSSATGRDIVARPARWRLPVAACVALLAALGIARAATSFARTSATPREFGFHTEETDRNGVRFRWMTRHAVSYIPREPGVLTLRLRHPDVPARERPLNVEVAIEGRPFTLRVLPEDEWTTIEVGLRDTGWGPFRRVDLRANQEWTQAVQLGQRPATRPISAMVEAIEWTSLDSVR